MPRSETGAAVVSILWQDGSWPEQSVTDKHLTEAFGEKGVECSYRSVTSESPQEFLKIIRDTLKENTNGQLIYISAHGFTEGLYRSNKADSPCISYDDLVHSLKECIPGSRSVTLVMGSCYAGTRTIPLLGLVPKNVRRFVGFTGKPTWKIVAKVFAAVVADDRRLLEALKNAPAPPTCSLGMKSSEIAKSIFTPVLEGFQSDLKQFVTAEDMKASESGQETDPGVLVDYVRNQDGEWVATVA